MKSWKKTNYDCMLNVIYVSLVYTSLSEYNKMYKEKGICCTIGFDVQHIPNHHAVCKTSTCVYHVYRVMLLYQ